MIFDAGKNHQALWALFSEGVGYRIAILD